MKKRIENASSSNSMNLLIVIDTEYVKTNYPSPSQDPNNPTGIDHNSQYMLCTGTRGIIKGQGTADLNFQANPGDYLSVFGQSIYGNADDAIIIYDLHYWSGTKVFNTFQVDLVTRQNAVKPQVGSGNGLPAVTGPDNFISLDSRVSTKGVENFYVYFALYTLDPSDGETQKLFGYYYWDPTITVS
jgi:hypothetical protein